MNQFAIIVYIIWFASEIIINRSMRAGNTDAKGKDKNSLAVIWLMVFGGMAAAVYISAATKFEILPQKTAFVTGLAVIVLGILLRIAAIRSLGMFFTASVTIRENHQLKKDGFYRLVRHPSYSASLLAFAGFGLALDNWISLLVIVFAMLSVFSYRISVEEQALAEYFGTEYESYRKSTKKLIPFIY